MVFCYFNKIKESYHLVEVDSEFGLSLEINIHLYCEIINFGAYYIIKCLNSDC